MTTDRNANVAADFDPALYAEDARTAEDDQETPIRLPHVVYSADILEALAKRAASDDYERRQYTEKTYQLLSRMLEMTPDSVDYDPRLIAAYNLYGAALQHIAEARLALLSFLANNDVS